MPYPPQQGIFQSQNKQYQPLDIADRAKTVADYAGGIDILHGELQRNTGFPGLHNTCHGAERVVKQETGHHDAEDQIDDLNDISASLGKHADQSVYPQVRTKACAV